MATVPPGPSSALSASPAEIPPFPGAGSAEPAGGDGEPVCCCREDGIPTDTGKTCPLVSEAHTSVQKNQKNMLARVSPAALHLKTQAREQQQLNGLSSSAEDTDSHEHAGSRPDNPRPSVDNCDSCCCSSSSGGSSSEEAPAGRNNSELCQQEGHSPFSKNGSSHSPLVNNTMNGMPGFSRTDAARSHPENQEKHEFDHMEPPRPPSDEPTDAAGPGGEHSPVDQQLQPPAAELARLDLSGSPGRAEEEDSHGIRYVRYESELQMPWIMRLITKDLSEPYSIYTYRYFIHNWPQLCFLAMVEQECVGAIVCKLDMHKKMFRRGYIAMLAVDSKHRRKSIGTNLVKKAIYAMVEGDCDEVVLETEITNKSALKLYENLGFVRDKRLFRYYLNGVDALRLKLWLR
ncbi:N-alpha-acetyltransferase 30 [Labrus bergylta]|uniref:N-alpha-acetyltransferase 30 n=1 Tax=Labrus bergylta TaxID=56723 RepID=A0A3Q3NFE5_9LABR|nr:N-alpha-acetyltransferase 30 [Labrus bergylta]